MKKLALTLFISVNAFALPPVTMDKLYGLDLNFSLTNELSPLLLSKQVYLEAPPLGVGAIDAWAIPGGKGENVKVIDVETGFNPDHEDLPAFFHQVVPTDSDHGTAVLGIMSGVKNDYGVTGIANEAQYGFSGFIEGDEDISDRYLEGIVKQIREATDLLGAGDVLVIEQQVTGPAGDYILVEYWDVVFNELKRATDKGIICLEAAGNGNSDLDQQAYNGLLDRSKRDSGCIVVGAGSISTKERLYFSNYGKIVDTFGYGGDVTATGYGDAFYDGKNKSYTNTFSGTSSATPIVSGAVALVSSIAKAQGKIISPLEMREALRKTGTSQGPSTQNKRIGNLPSLPELLRHFELN